MFSVEFKGEMINMNNLEQNDEGNVFAIAYQDNGHFYVKVIDNKGKTLDTLDVSGETALDYKSTQIIGFEEPLITTVFIPGDNLYVSTYHRI